MLFSNSFIFLEETNQEHVQRVKEERVGESITTSSIGEFKENESNKNQLKKKLH